MTIPIFDHLTLQLNKWNTFLSISTSNFNINQKSFAFLDSIPLFCLHIFFVTVLVSLA